ncbi:MAG: hypothetical protein H7145_03800 [Akkermansiaceae bacterium]|nr:hypothetical protein [Armatimonadota bacterium]
MATSTKTGEAKTSVVVRRDGTSGAKSYTPSVPGVTASAPDHGDTAVTIRPAATRAVLARFKNRTPNPAIVDVMQTIRDSRRLANASAPDDAQ